MDNKESAGAIAAALLVLEPAVAGLRAALGILQDGFNSDVDAARAAIAPEVAELTKRAEDAEALLAGAPNAPDEALPVLAPEPMIEEPQA